MIEVKNLVKKYGKTTALNGISFELEEGEIVGILGPNGAGKTTLLRVIVDFLNPTSGSVVIDGLDVAKSKFKQKIKNRIGYLPEHTPLYNDMTVSEYLEFIGKMQEIDNERLDEKIANVVEKCGLKEKKNAEISTLSKGYKQRTGIAQALIHDPKIVILDEPTTGLDPNQRIEIRELIKEIGKSKTVILSSHILSEVQATCSRVLIINKGEIVADGTPEELERKGRSRPLINVEVEYLGSNLLPRLREMSGIAEIEVVKNKISIISDFETDLRKDIAKIVVEENCGLLELTQKQVDLEDVFISLTKDSE